MLHYYRIFSYFRHGVLDNYICLDKWIKFQKAFWKICKSQIIKENYNNIFHCPKFPVELENLKIDLTTNNTEVYVGRFSFISFYNYCWKLEINIKKHLVIYLLVLIHYDWHIISSFWRKTGILISYSVEEPLALSSDFSVWCESVKNKEIWLVCINCSKNDFLESSLSSSKHSYSDVWYGTQSDNCCVLELRNIWNKFSIKYSSRNFQVLKLCSLWFSRISTMLRNI